MDKKNAHWVVWISLLCAYILSIVTLPRWLMFFWPAWIPMVVMFWIIYLPYRFGLTFAFFVGLIFDVFLDSYFGENSISLLVVGFASLANYRRIRFYSWWRQSGFVFLVLIVYQLINLWIHSLVRQQEVSVFYLFTSVMSTLMWGGVVFVLKKLKNIFRVN